MRRPPTRRRGSVRAGRAWGGASRKTRLRRAYQIYSSSVPCVIDYHAMTIFVISAVLFTTLAPPAGQRTAPTRADWIALATGGFVVPSGRTAVEMLLDMNQLLASNDPALRD